MPSYEQVHLAVDRILRVPGSTQDSRTTRPRRARREGQVHRGSHRPRGQFCGHALYNSTSDIRLRMLSRGGAATWIGPGSTSSA